MTNFMRMSESDTKNQQEPIRKKPQGEEDLRRIRENKK
jgi:hypothetical protein